MAFLRRKGRSHYLLLHNIRNAGRVRQLYLACLGSRPEITEETVRAVRGKYPNLRIDWHKLRAAVSPPPPGCLPISTRPSERCAMLFVLSSAIFLSLIALVWNLCGTRAGPMKFSCI